jgi:hypothetical protein
LDPEELIDALDDRLPAERRRHLEACDRCQGAVADVVSAAGLARRAAEVPEPSPWFWDGMSRRIQAATRANSEPARSAWRVDWRWWAGVSAAAALALVFGVREQTARPFVASTALATSWAPAASGAGDGAEASLNFVVQLASSVPYDELQTVARPTVSATDAMVGQLTADERAELVRLIKAAEGIRE